MSEKTGNKKILHILFIDVEKDGAELADLNLKKASLHVTTASTPKERAKEALADAFD